MTKTITINKPLTLVYFNNLILGELTKQGINAWIAGGVLRDYFLQKPLKSDCDIFFPSESEFQKAKSYLLSKGGKVVWESDNGMKVIYKGNTYDLIKIYMSNPMATISRFDFTISMFATDGKDLYYGNNSVKDLQDKKLVINTIVNPLSTLKRVLKHYKKGFTMSAEETKKLYQSLNSLPYDETNDLLNASGSSGENIIPQVAQQENTTSTPIAKKPDYTKYILIGGVILILGYVVGKRFNK